MTREEARLELIKTIAYTVTTGASAYQIINMAREFERYIFETEDNPYMPEDPFKDVV